MKISFITDEVTQSFEEAVRFAKENRLQGVELRSVEDMAIDKVPEETLKEWKRRLDEEGLEVSNLSSSFFKCAMQEDEVLKELKKLERLCAAADILGCGTIRGFAFFETEGKNADREVLAEQLKKAVPVLRDRKKKLLLEADPSVNTTNHGQLAELLRLLDPAYFGAIYDPGNDLFDPERERPFPEGYRAVLKYLAHVHVKDAVYGADGAPVCVAPGRGLVGYERLLFQLRADGYDGWLSLEPHYRKNVVLTEEQMRVPQGAAFSFGGAKAGVESAAALHALLDGIGWKAEAAI